MVLFAASGVAFAGPGEGIRVGNMVISPFFSGSLTYDSNVFLDKAQQKEDFFTDLVPGVSFLNRTEQLTVRGRGWLQFRDYFKYTEKNSQGVGERVGLIYGTQDDPFITVDERYVRLEDYEISPRSVDTLNTESQQLLLTEDRTERVKRDLFDIGAVVGRWLVDEKLRLDVGYAFGMVNYDTDLLFDWQEHIAQAEAQLKCTEKTSALLTGQYGVQDSKGFPKNPDDYIIRLGLLTRATGKTTLKGGVGYESYRAGFTSLAGESLDENIVNFDVAAVWDATPKLSFQASARNGIQPATQYERNTKKVLLLEVGSSYYATDTLLASLAGSYRNDDYLGSVKVGNDFRSKERELYGVRARLDYRPHARFYELYLEGSYENVTDNLEDDYPNYDQLRLTAGIFVRY